MNKDKHALDKLSLFNPVHFLALGFGSGLSPVMPGTVGTFAAVPLVYLMAVYLSLPMYGLVCLLAATLGVWICGKAAEDMGEHDHGAIVWDEIAGYMLAMLAVPLNWQNMLVAFVLFRFFDIVKPWPICWLDKRVGAGWGIMLDDIVAGFFSLICVQLLLYFSWL